MRTSKKGLQLIKQHEGWRATAYKDPVELWTIGYGHLIKHGEEHLLSVTLTPEQGEELLKSDVAWAEQAVLKYVQVNIDQNQFDALVSFVFNLGSENFRTSTLLKQINAGATEAEIRYEFSRWNKAKGQVLAGLTTRRQSEADLYFTA